MEKNALTVASCHAEHTTTHIIDPDHVTQEADANSTVSSQLLRRHNAAAGWRDYAAAGAAAKGGAGVEEGRCETRERDGGTQRVYDGPY